MSRNTNKTIEFGANVVAIFDFFFFFLLLSIGSLLSRNYNSTGVCAIYKRKYSMRHEREIT